MKLPQLEKKPEIKSCHNKTWTDDYSWIHQPNILEVLRDSSKLLPEVRKYLEDENEFFSDQMKDTKHIQKKLFDERKKTPPRSNEVTTISVVGENIVVWSRGGKFKRIESNTGEIIEEGKIDVECDLEVVFNHGENFLLSSNDGWIWEYQGGEITVARKLRGSIQDAVFDGEDWRIICWRDDIMLRGDSTTRKELGVQLIFQDEIWQVLDNQGQISPHMNA